MRRADVNRTEQMDEDIKASQAEVAEARGGLRKIELELKELEKEVATTHVSKKIKRPSVFI
jgi:septal ring factor EnvC (AmiA/AmiB activator)